MSSLCRLLPYSVIVSLATAQAPPPVPVPGKPAAAPLTAPTRTASKFSPDGKITEPIVLPALNGTELAGFYRKLTGHRVIVSSGAANREFAFIQDASPENPLTVVQVAALLRKAAGIEGFFFLPDEADPKLEYLFAERPQGGSIGIVSEGEALPEEERVVSYVMTFKHLKPEEAVRTILQIIGQLSSYGSITALDDGVVITDNTSLIRRLIRLKEKIDTPAAIPVTRFFTVKSANVSELSVILNELLSEKPQVQRSGFTSSVRSGVPGAAPAPGTAPTPVPVTTVAEKPPLRIVADPRTKRIIAMGRPVDMLFLEQLIRELDIETPGTKSAPKPTP